MNLYTSISTETEMEENRQPRRSEKQDHHYGMKLTIPPSPSSSIRTMAMDEIDDKQNDFIPEYTQIQKISKVRLAFYSMLMLGIFAVGCYVWIHFASFLFPIGYDDIDHRGMQLCFLESEGSPQCQGSRDSCSDYSSNTIPSPTLPFRDNTDHNVGGCTYHWEVKESNPTVNREYRMCFREIECTSGQCEGSRNTCSHWGDNNSWTSPFRDNTNSSIGGCTYTWWIEEQYKYGEPLKHCRIHFLETEGMRGQCGGNRSTVTGWSNNPAYSAGFRDHTDNRPGGCIYQWRLECI